MEWEKKSLGLLYSYLKGRTQGVKINGSLSELLEILFGVPQGSILGPILFNIFLNDMMYYIKSATPHNYADDNNLSAHAKTEDDLIKKLEQGADEAVCWLAQNEMIANPDKFKAILITKDKSDLSKKEININNLKIITQNDVEYPGLNIDNKLSL